MLKHPLNAPLVDILERVGLSDPTGVAGKHGVERVYQALGYQVDLIGDTE